MSRICVKSLPKYVKEDRLREFFSQKGEVTDAKLMHTRQFAFIGFRTEKEAQEALRYFNNTYMDTCKITCEVARKVGDSTIPQPWSRHSLKKEVTLCKNKSKSKDNKPSKLDRSKDSSDPKLQEFLHVMQPRAKSKIWENDMTGILEQETKTEEKKFFKTKNSNEAIVDDTTRLPIEVESIADMDYFKSRVRKNWSDSESGSISGSKSEELLSGSKLESESESESESDSRHRDGESESEKKLALDTGRLFIRNLPYTTTEDELLELFGQYGDVSQVHIVVDRDTRRSKGICFVLFTSPEAAVRALEELDNSSFQGRLLHIMAAKPQKSHKSASDERVLGAKSSLKKIREEKRKESEASGDTRAWNSLFVRQDTVVENIARKNGITKSELLDREADDLAVRIALGETHIIAETKKSLSKLGVNVCALEESVSSKRNESTKKSNHVILVKNLPYSCSEGDLVSMFGTSIEKVILPPSRALALVIFLEPAQALSAFKALSYRRYKDSPLYLEWAPDNIFSLSPTSVAGDTEEAKDELVRQNNVKKVLLDQSLVDEEDTDPDRVESRSLFVKNLNFSRQLMNP